MKYDDDELAEAALFLAAHAAVEHEPPMPAALERKILAKGLATVTEARFSTTKAGVVSIEPAPPAPPATRRQLLTTWAGWIAAAACFAFAVYEWRASTVTRGAHTSSVAASSSKPPSHLLGPDGSRVAEVTWDADEAGGRIDVLRMPPADARVTYALWLSSDGADAAEAVGSFACDHDCSDRSFRFAQRLREGKSPRRLWLARVRPESPTTLDESLVVGRGER